MARNCRSFLFGGLGRSEVDDFGPETPNVAGTAAPLSHLRPGRNPQSLTGRPTAIGLVLRCPEGASKDDPVGASTGVSAVWSILRGPLLSQRAPQDEGLEARIPALTIEDSALREGPDVIDADLPAPEYLDSGSRPRTT